MPEHGTRACYRTGCRLQQCKDANAAYHREWYAKNAEHARSADRAYRVGWYARTRDDLNAKRREQSKRNPQREKHAERMRQWRAKKRAEQAAE